MGTFAPWGHLHFFSSKGSQVAPLRHLEQKLCGLHLKQALRNIWPLPSLFKWWQRALWQSLKQDSYTFNAGHFAATKERVNRTRTAKRT